MYQLLSRKLRQVTPEVAEEFLEMNNYAGQRPLRHKHIQELSDTIESGHFTTGSIAVAHQGWNGGDKMLANGQHQCTAVIETQKPIIAVVEEYDCKRPEDFADLYRQFDCNPPRTLADIARPEAMALNIEWPHNIISNVLSAIYFLEGQKGLHKNYRVQSLRKYIREGNFVNDIFSCAPQSDTRHMRRSPVIAAMITTFRKCSSDAEKFWEEVRDGENLKLSSPSLRLRNYLLSTSINVGRGVNADSLNSAASAKEMFTKCIVAWNAYRSGGTTQLKYFPNKGIPKVV